ncbi:hypothetical protein EXT70_17895 [Dickeya dadantii]|nr:hypothetical protein [Dickeya dadantii]
MNNKKAIVSTHVNTMYLRPEKYTRRRFTKKSQNQYNKNSIEDRKQQGYSLLKNLSPMGYLMLKWLYLLVRELRYLPNGRFWAICFLLLLLMIMSSLPKF